MHPPEKSNASQILPNDDGQQPLQPLFAIDDENCPLHDASPLSQPPLNAEISTPPLSSPSPSQLKTQMSPATDVRLHSAKISQALTAIDGSHVHKQSDDRPFDCEEAPTSHEIQATSLLSSGDAHTKTPEINAQTPLSSTRAVAANLIKSMVGSGILFLPREAIRVGVVPAAMLLAVAALFGGCGLVLFLFLASRIGGRLTSIRTLSAMTFPWLGVLFDGVVVVKCVLVAGVYLKLCAEQSATLFGVDRVANTFADPLIKVCFAAALFPLACLQKLGPLRYTSYAGLGSVVYVVFLAAAILINRGVSNDGGFSAFQPQRTLTEYLGSLPSFMFAFMCHQNVFPLYNEAKKNGLRHMSVLVAAAVAVSMAVYALFAIFAAAALGSEALTNKTALDVFLDVYTRSGSTTMLFFVRCGCALYVLLLVGSYPLQTLPLKISATNMLLGGSKPQSARAHRATNIGLSVAAVLASLLLSMWPKDVGFGASLAGALTSPLIMAAFPSAYFLRLVAQKHWPVRKTLVTLFGGVGCLLVPLTFYGTWQAYFGRK